MVRFKGKSPEDIPCEVIIDDKYHESIEDDEMYGSYGGFKMFAKRGRIVLSQTIEDRVELCF